MVCFSGQTSNLFVRILAVFQMALQVSCATVGVFGLIRAWADRNETGDSSRGNGHHCECILKTRPVSCELVDTPIPNVDEHANLWDPLFVVLNFWIVLLSILGMLKDLRYGPSRLLNAGLFLVVGSLMVGLGDHYDLIEFEIVGYLAAVFCIILATSVPICGRYRQTEGVDEESRLTDNDEFGQAHGVFSSLND